MSRHGQLDLVHERLGRVIEEQVCLIEEERQLGLRQVPGFRQGLVELGEEPQHERAEQARLGHHIGQFQDADDALAVGCHAHQVGDIERRLPEEDIRALLLQHDQRTQQDTHGRLGHAAVLIEDGLAKVGGQELERGRQVRQVQQGQRLVVAVLEHQ